MQVIYIHMMISLVGGFCVLSYGQGSGLRNILKINHDLSDRGVYRVLSRSIWKRHGINRNDRANGQATGMSSTGVSSRKADDTSVHNLNSAGLMLKRITTAKRERPEHRSLSVSTESETVNSGGCCRRRIEKLNSERPAVMETPGGDDTFPKPPSISKPRVGMRNRRRRRAAAEDTLKRREENKQLKNTSLGSTQTMWEPMPRPLALNLSTDIPFDMTTNLETFPDDELFVATTLVPLLTRGKANRLKNPFYPLSSESYGAYTILCISVIIFLVGILGNIAITCIVCQNFYMRSISNSLLANLALWDFVILFFCMPLIIFHELTKTWLLGEFSCKIIPYIEVASLGVTTFTLCALCIDRYRAATNVQMYYEMMENCSSTAAKLAVIWVGALLLALPELLLRQLEMDESQPTGSPSGERCAVRVSTELPDPIYVLGLTYQGARLWWYFGCYFCLPTLFTIISSLATARKIQRAERACVRGTKKQIRLESQMNCTVVALAILYGLCIVPENICNIVSAYMAAGVPRHTLDVLQLLGQLLLFCKSAAAPVLLLCLCRPFGRAFLDCCCCCCAECGSSAGGTAAADDDRECTAELELSPFNTVRRETSPYAPVGTRC